jgi:Virulence activator alpha C-term
VPHARRRPKRYYRITEAGEQAFRAWLRYGEVDPPMIKHSVMLRLFFGHRGDADRLRAVLTDYQGWLAEQRSDLDAVSADLLPDFPYPRLVALWGDAFYAAEAKAVETVLAELDRMARGE